MKKKKYLLLFIITFQFIYSVCYAEDFFLSAQQVFKDDKNEVIKANGSVEIQKGKIRIKSDNLIYNTKINEVKLKGNIQIFSESGDLIFAKEAILNDTLKSGIIKNLGLLMSDGSRLAASSANTEESKSKSVYKNIVFTKCLECKKDKEVLWKLKAKKATHLKKSKIILYESVFLEVFKIPIIYVPLFYHPDPTVKRKTGLLTPKISSSSIFGYSYEQPVYLNLSEKSDFTINPKFTTKEGIILDNNYRKKFDTGELELRSSITKGTKVRKNAPSKKEVRGHIDFKYANNLASNWLIGANIKRSSDKSYLYRYGMSSGETLLTQNVYIEKGDLIKNIAIEGYKFQSLSGDYLSEDLPFIRPLVVYNWSNLNNKNRNRNKKIKLVTRSITRNNQDFTNATHLKFKDSKKYLTGGALLNNYYSLNFDFYNSKNLQSIEKNTARIMPEIGVQYQYPFMKLQESNSSVFEPIIQFILSPDDNKSEDIKNEDSLETELTSSNLFEENKYSGFDRLEKGFRSNYGFLYKVNNSTGSSITSSLGRVYHANNQENFAKKNGFKENNSDIVGNFGYVGSKKAEIYYKFRFSEDLILKKNRVKTNFDFLNTDFNMSYMQIRDFASSNNSDTEQLNFGLKKKLFKNWEFSISQFRDLASAKYSGPLRTNLGIGFNNECLSFNVNLTKDKSNAVDIPASTNLSFTFDLFSM